MLRLAKQVMGVVGACLLLIVGGGAFFSSELLQAWVTFELSHLGQEVSWKTWEREGEGFVVEDFSLVLDRASGEAVHARRLHILPAIDFSCAHLTLAVEGEGVALRLVPKRLLQRWQSSWPSWLRLSFLPTIHEGAITFLEEGGGAKEAIPFTLSSRLHEEVAALSVHFPKAPGAALVLHTRGARVQQVSLEHFPLVYLDKALGAFDPQGEWEAGHGWVEGMLSWAEGGLIGWQVEVAEADFVVKLPQGCVHVDHFTGKSSWEKPSDVFGGVGASSWQVAAENVQVLVGDFQMAFGGCLEGANGAFSFAEVAGQVGGLAGTLTYSGHKSPWVLEVLGSVGQAIALGSAFHKEQTLVPWDDLPLSLSLELFSFDEGLLAQGDVEVGEPFRAAPSYLQFSLALPSPDTLWKNLSCEALAHFASSFKACLFAKEMALESHLSWWLQRRCGMTLEGTASFKAVCDGRGYHVTFDPADVALDHERFSIQIPKVEHHVRPYLQGTWDGGITTGSALFQGARYVEKNTGLVFEETRASLSYDDGRLCLDGVATQCQGVALEGRLQLEWLEGGQMALQIASPSFGGSCLDFAALVGTLSPQIGWQDILAGQVSSCGTGLSLEMIMGGGKTAIRARLEGSLEGAEGFLPVFGGAICGLQADFVYEYPSHALTVQEVVAQMGVAGRRAPERFSLYSPKIFFPDLFSEAVEFDLRSVAGSQIEWRLLGKTEGGRDDVGDPTILVELDSQASYIGSLLPRIELLELGEGKALKRLKASPRLDLAAFRHSIEVLVNVGWLPSSSGLFTSLSRMEGDLDAQVMYDRARGWDFAVRGEHLAFEEQTAASFSLKGACHEGRWRIDSLRLDDFAMTSEFEYAQEVWSVPFLGIRLADALFLGMHGTFDGQRQVLAAQLTQLEVDLDKLAAMPRFASFKELLSPSGKIRAEGEVELDLSHPTSWRADATVDLSVRDLEVRGLQVTLDRHIRCCYSSVEGLSTRGAAMQLSLKEAYPAAKVAVALKAAGYQIATNSWQVEGLQFDIPIQDFYAFSEKFSSVAPKGDEVPLWLRELKPDGKIQGELSASGQGKNLQVQCALADGEYLLQGKRWHIERLCLEYALDRWHLQGQVEYEGEYFFTVLEPEGMPWRQGKLLVSQPVRHKDQVMQIDWQIHESGRVMVSKISGLCHGVAATLQRLPEATTLKGRVTLTAPEVVSLFPTSISERLLSWEVSGRGTLEGDWEICDDKGIVFEGEFQSPALSLLECSVHNLSGKMSFDEAHVELKDVIVQDRAGVLCLPAVSLAKGTMGGWHLQVPHLEIQHLRPGLLLGKEKEKRSLVITHADLYKVQGDLSRPETLTGKGSAQFVYPSSGSFLGGLFVIPADILSRIGFDLSVLSPVSGKVHYTLQDAKLYLTSFEEMYSQGKRSKFYLAKGQYHSYIDFSGNLHVFVRMKQYNLVFKMAELFMIHVDGTIDRPSYSLLPSHAYYDCLAPLGEAGCDAQAL